MKILTLPHLTKAEHISEIIVTLVMVMGNIYHSPISTYMTISYISSQTIKS